MKKTLKTIFLGLTNLASLWVVLNWLNIKAQAASPAPTFPPLKITEWTKLKFANPSDIINLIATIYGYLALYCAAFAVIAFIYSGIMYITSSGNPESAQKAKRNLTWAITAIVIIVVVGLIPAWIYDILSKEAPLK